MSSWPHDTRRVPRDAGLTLIELLVAAAVAMILIVSVYAIYAASSRGFRVQEQMMGAMQQARFGMAQLQRDIASAGFLATPASDVDPNVCPKPSVRLPGIVFQTGGDVANPARNQNIQPQQVTLLGAFWSPAIYFTRSIAGNAVTLSNAPESPLPATEAEFTALFQPKRFLRIVNADQFEMYLPIQGTDFATRTVTLESEVPVASPPNYCGVQGFGVGLEVSVVGYVRYRLVAAAADPQDATTVAKVDLVREELDGTDATLDTVIDGSVIRIAEYVADLQFHDFVLDTDLTRRQPVRTGYPTLAAANATGTYRLDLAAGSRPQDLRFVTVRLTTRTVDEDESLRFVARTAVDSPLETYELDPVLAGAARTVSLAARVGLPSFQVRNVK